jgi:O-antigen ligase
MSPRAVAGIEKYSMTNTAIFVGLAAAAVTAASVAFTGAPELALLALAGLVLATIIILWPRTGLILVVASTPFEDFLAFDYGTVRICKLALVALVTLRFWLMGRHEGTQQRIEDPYRKFFLLLVISAFLSTLLSGSLLRSAAGPIQFLLLYGYYRSISRAPVTRQISFRLLDWLLWVAYPVAALAFLQAFFGYGGWLGSSAQRAFEVDGRFQTAWNSIERASSTFGSSNAAGAFFGAVCLIAGLHALIFATRRLHFLILAGICGLALLATNSRGAIFGLALALFVYFLKAHGVGSRWRRLALGSILLTAILLFTPSQGLMDYFRIGDSLAESSLSRIEAWSGSFDIIRANPVFGIGFYGFQEEVEMGDPRSEAPIHSHNGFLKALVEQGIAGGVAYLLLVWIFLRNSFASLRSCTMNKHYLWLFSSITCIGLTLFAQELFDAGLTIGTSSVAILFATLLGIQTSVGHARRAAALPPPSGMSGADIAIERDAI